MPYNTTRSSWANVLKIVIIIALILNLSACFTIVTTLMTQHEYETTSKHLLDDRLLGIAQATNPDIQRLSPNNIVLIGQKKTYLILEGGEAVSSLASTQLLDKAKLTIDVNDVIAIEMNPESQTFESQSIVNSISHEALSSDERHELEALGFSLKSPNPQKTKLENTLNHQHYLKKIDYKGQVLPALSDQQIKASLQAWDQPRVIRLYTTERTIKPIVFFVVPLAITLDIIALPFYLILGINAAIER
jgi:hypothetical protein